MSGNDLFFDPTTDEKLRCAKKKLAQKRAKYAELCALLQSEVAKHRANPGICKLFLGFRKLGEFTDIPQARKFAEESGETGTFNLIGNRFRKSWYLPKCLEYAVILMFNSGAKPKSSFSNGLFFFRGTPPQQE